MLLSSTAIGQIRMYDPTTGETKPVEQHQGVERPPSPPPPPATTNPTVVAPSPASIADGTVGTVSHLGQAKVFISIDIFNAALANQLKELKDYEGLTSQIYVEDLMPEEYLKLAAQAEEAIAGLSFRVDSGGIQARRNQVRENRTIVYLDPTGTRRYYDVVTEFDKFRRHVKRIERKLKNR